MKTKIVGLTLFAFVLSLAVFVAAVLTEDRTRYHNNFVRIFPQHAAEAISSVEFGTRKMSIAGFANGSVYLQSNRGLIALSMDMLDTCTVDIKVPFGHEVILDDMYFYFYNGNTAQVSRGAISNWNVDTTYTSIPEFIALQPVSKGSFVLQTIDNLARKSVFIKSTDLVTQKDILKKQIDGIMCTDGFLLFNKTSNSLVYVYRYRNQFICLDTCLNILHESNTIDTTSTARISVVEVDGVLKMSKPPFIVNRSTCVDGLNLFVNSNLTARNELIQNADEQSVIDVYSILDGSYRHSFYIKNLNDSRMLSFRVMDTTLFAVFPNSIVRYDLTSKYLKD